MRMKNSRILQGMTGQLNYFARGVLFCAVCPDCYNIYGQTDKRANPAAHARVKEGDISVRFQLLFFCSVFAQACGDRCKTLAYIREMMKTIPEEDKGKKVDILIDGLHRALEKKRRLGYNCVYVCVKYFILPTVIVYKHVIWPIHPILN